MGRDRGQTRKFTFPLIALLLAGIMLLLAGCVESPFPEREVTYSDKLTFFKPGWHFEDEAVVGKAKNTTDEILSYCEVNAYFYEGGVRVEEGMRNVTDLKPDEIFKYKIPSFERNFVGRVEVKEGECWH